MQIDSPDELTPLVARSRDGDRAALDELIRTVQPLVYKVAQRFLMRPADAEDATQEILLKVITRLAQFDGQSKFTTWVYRVTSNHLLDLKKQEKRRSGGMKWLPIHTMSFDEFGADLADGLAEALTDRPEEAIDTEMMLAEVRISCTLALMQCLGSEARIAYILGEILELDHRESAEVLQISSAAFRQRLSRARGAISNFMMGHCGLVNPANKCRCHKRLDKALKTGRVDPGNLVFASSGQAAREFPQVLKEVRKLQQTSRVTALYRSQEQAPLTETFIHWLRNTLERNEGLG